MIMINKTVYSIIETIIPFSTNISEKERKIILKEVSSFVILRINRLFFLIKIPIVILIILFELSSFLTTFKMFSLLNHRNRQNHIYKSLNWPLLHFHDLIKLVRSLTLLAYFDNPIVRRNIGYAQLQLKNIYKD